MRDYTKLLERQGREGERLTFQYVNGCWVVVGSFKPDMALSDEAPPVL